MNTTVQRCDEAAKLAATLMAAARDRGDFADAAAWERVWRDYRARSMELRGFTAARPPKTWGPS